MARTKKPARKKAVPSQVANSSRSTKPAKKPTLTFASSVKKPTLTFASKVKKSYYQHHYGSKRYLNGELEGQITKDGKFKIKYDNGKVKRFRITKRGAVLVKSTKRDQNGKYNYYYCTNRRDCKLARGMYKQNQLFNSDNLGLPR